MLIGKRESHLRLIASRWPSRSKMGRSPSHAAYRPHRVRRPGVRRPRRRRRGSSPIGRLNWKYIEEQLRPLYEVREDLEIMRTLERLRGADLNDVHAHAARGALNAAHRRRHVEAVQIRHLELGD